MAISKYGHKVDKRNDAAKQISNDLRNVSDDNAQKGPPLSDIHLAEDTVRDQLARAYDEL
jgi:hypothetical protein